MTRWLCGGIAVLVTVHLAVLAYHLGSILVFPYDLEYGEGYVLNDAVRLARGEPIYTDVREFPMVRSPYPPLFPLVWSGLLFFTAPSFAAGRALSVVALAGVGVLLAWNAWRACPGMWPALTAVAVLAASPFVYQWAGYARVDLLALVFATGGVLVAQWSRGWRAVFGAAVLCGLAIWTKQTMLTACLAVFVALALRNWRQGLGFMMLVGLPSVALVWLLNQQTSGEFARHVLLGNAANPFFFERAVYYMVMFAALHLPLLAAGVWWLRRALGGLPSPIALYLAVSLLTMVSAGNAGSSVNYLLEPLVALALAVSFAWRALPRTAAVVAPLLAVTQLAVLLHWPNGFGTGYLADFGLGHTPTDADRAVGARLDELVRQTQGAVVSEPAGFALRNNRPVYVQPIDMRAEERLGRWDGTRLVASLSAREFDVVVTSYDFFPLDVQRAIEGHFELQEELPGPGALRYRVYKHSGAR